MSKHILAVTSLESFIQLVGALLIFVFVLAITYLVTKWLGGYQKAQTKYKNLKTIEMIPVGNGKMIALLQAGKKYLVVSIGKEEIHLLAELSEEELTDLSFQEEALVKNTKESFQYLLEKMKEKLPKK